MTRADIANGLSAMDPRDGYGRSRPNAQVICDAAAALLRLDQTGYAAGRKAVCDELRAAVDRFNDDDSMGIGQLIEVIAPWLEEGRP